MKSKGKCSRPSPPRPSTSVLGLSLSLPLPARLSDGLALVRGQVEVLDDDLAVLVQKPLSFGLWGGLDVVVGNRNLVTPLGIETVVRIFALLRMSVENGSLWMKEQNSRRPRCLAHPQFCPARRRSHGWTWSEISRPEVEVSQSTRPRDSAQSPPLTAMVSSKAFQRSRKLSKRSQPLNEILLQRGRIKKPCWACLAAACTC